MRLARHIRENQLMVLAEEECVSACVMLLAASPQAAIWPGTTVTFHRPEPVVDPIIPEFGSESMLYIREAARTYREFGIADWAIEIAGRQQFWTPTVDQQIKMSLIAFIYDIDRNDFVPAIEYCDAHPTECS